MDFFDQGIPLGRWFRIRVILHWTFLLYAGLSVFSNGVFHKEQLAVMAILFGVVLLHEFGHALSCRAVGGTAERIVLWPLGGMAFVQPPEKAWAYLITTVCGPLVNLILWLAFIALRDYGLEPIGQRFGVDSAFFFGLTFTTFWMIKINLMLLLFNLIPAYPMDGGRILQELLWMILGYRASLQIAGMIGAVIGCGFVILGLGLHSINLPLVGELGHKGVADMNLILIGALCAMNSFGIYYRSMEIAGYRKKK
jgi:Zn-dependent protease